jgi:DNA-binding response OmpR family regulator
MNDQTLELTSSEFRLLTYLMENDHRVVPPAELVRVVRQYECEHVQEARDIIKWYIYRLRRKLEPNPSRPRFILNVRGVGYTFKG